MAGKEIKYSAVAREKMLRGVDSLADAVKVTRFALQNAASVAGLLMTTGAMVAEKPDKKKPEVPAMPPEDMY